MSKQLNRATVWLMGLTALAYALAYLRDAGIGALFGASPTTDAFFVGTSPAMALYTIMIVGSFVPALIPVLAHVGSAKREGVLGATSRWLVFGMVALVFVCEIMAGPLISLLAPGFDRGSLQEATLYCRLSLPMLLFLAPSGVAAAALNLRQEFVVPGAGAVVFGAA